MPVADRQGDGAYRFEAVDLRAQLAAGRSVHARILDGLRKHVFDRVTPGRIVALTRLGEDRGFVACEDLVKWFFSYFDFPKIRSESVLRDAIARGTAANFGYVASAEIREDELHPRQRTSVWFGEPLDPGEIDLGPGAFIIAVDVAESFVQKPEGGPESVPAVAAPTGEGVSTEPGLEREGDGEPSRYRLRAAMTAEQLFRVLPALQNLADRSDRFVARIEVEAQARESYDRNWLRNAVEEHIEEAGVDAEKRIE